DPAPLLHAIAHLGADPKTTIYVGDSRTDWKTAAAADVRYVHLPGGYEDETPPGSAWRILDTLQDMEAIIVSSDHADLPK
ncbi:MAG: HAD hydrolase-like protein, partial [Pseudomonadota bacterium]